MKEKYQTRTAALYRDKISTLADGREWSMEASPAFNYEPPKPKEMVSIDPMTEISKDEITSRREDFFRRKQEENALKSDDLPPSQGGRYVGFGSKREVTNDANKNEFLDNAWSAFSSGWASFTSGATKFGTTVNDSVFKPVGEKAKEFGTTIDQNVMKPTKQKLSDSKIFDNMSSSMNVLATKIKSAGESGISEIQTLIKGKKAEEVTTDQVDTGHDPYDDDVLKEEKNLDTEDGGDEWNSWGNYEGWGRPSSESKQYSSKFDIQSSNTKSTHQSTKKVSTDNEWNDFTIGSASTKRTNDNSKDDSSGWNDDWDAMLNSDTISGSNQIKSSINTKSVPKKSD